MLTAIRQSDKIKVIGEFIDKKKSETYYCEYCENPVTHNKSDSKIKVGHFKHKSGEPFCKNNTGETLEHIKTKLGIYNYIKENYWDKLLEIEPEKWICKKSIRPDVYIETKKNTKIAIEVQASILPVSEIKRRTEKYFKEKINVLWVIIYDYNRFNKYKTEYGKTEDGSWGVVNSGYFYADKVRLKEFEIFIYWAYFKNLIMWDLTGNHSNSFIVANMSDHKTDSVEFRRDGNDHYYEGKTTKVMKVPNYIRLNVSFDEFKPSPAIEFPVNYRQYVIPERLIFNYHTKPKK